MRSPRRCGTSAVLSPWPARVSSSRPDPLVGCTALLPAGPSTDAPELCGFPPGTELAFVGHSSLQQLTLGHPLDVAEGEFYITAEFIPSTHAHIAPMRQWCVIAEEGYMQGDGIPEDWTPPARP